MKKEVVVFLVLVIVVGVGAFFGGMKYQKSKSPSFGGRFGQGALGEPNGSLRQRAGQNFSPVNGEITSSDENGITVRLQDGSSKIVVFSESTQFVKTEAGAKEDLIVGDKVMVVGTANSEGVVTAQNVQINPPQRIAPIITGTQNSQDSQE